MKDETEVVFEVHNLSKEFKTFDSSGKTEIVKAIKNVSFSVNLGNTLGIVGESGSGKSTIGRCVLGLTKISSGEIILGGRNNRITGSHSSSMLSSNHDFISIFIIHNYQSL